MGHTFQLDKHAFYYYFFISFENPYHLLKYLSNFSFQFLLLIKTSNYSLNSIIIAFALLRTEDLYIPL